MVSVMVNSQLLLKCLKREWMGSPTHPAPSPIPLGALLGGDGAGGGWAGWRRTRMGPRLHCDPGQFLNAGGSRGRDQVLKPVGYEAEVGSSRPVVSRPGLAS